MNAKSKLTVVEIMSTQYLHLPGMSTVAEALREMTAANAHSVLVDKRSDDDEYGIVLTSDIAKHVLAKDRSPERVNLYEIMTKPVLSVRPGMSIRYCARMLDHFGISTVPVVENGEVLGIVTYDVLVLKGLATQT
jgi:signal-transduction protein with cAMP-binding, CBS, and nucleotidyltransferase domain